MSRLRLRVSPATGIALAALFVALGGTGYAVVKHGIPDRAGVFHAGVDSHTGAVRLVPRSNQCRRARTGRHPRSGERPVSWSQTGPQGKPGPSDGYYAATPGGKANSETVSLQLPSGDYLVSGGCTATNTLTQGQSTTIPTFGHASSYLTASNDPVQKVSGPPPNAVASVPNMGAVGLSPGPGAWGSANLANTRTVALPSSGTVTELCVDTHVAPGVPGRTAVQGMTYTNLYISAVRVDTLHS